MAAKAVSEMPIHEDRKRKAARLAWSVCPAGWRPGLAVAVIAVLLLTASYAAFVMTSLLAGLIAAAFLIVVLRGFFLPTHYQIDETGVHVRGLWRSGHVPWRQARRFGHDARGAFLSRRSKPSLMDSFSGLHLTWSENREQAVALVEFYRSRVDRE